MELKRIRELAKLLNTMGLEELSLEETSGEKISLRRPAPQTVYAAPQPPVTVAAAPGAVAPVRLVAPKAPPVRASIPIPDPVDMDMEVEVEVEAKIKDDSILVTVTSPLMGVFYAAPAPDAPPFVSLGQAVKAGDVLCVIEAMRLMNEIVAEQDGVVVQCIPAQGQQVDFGQPLFKMRCI